MNQIKITTADKMLRELQLIEFLFRLQLSDEYDNDPDLTIINVKGERINGRFMGRPFMIYSQTELFNIQAFKQEFTERFENAQNTTLIINQAKEIKDKASSILRFIKENWNEDNYKVKEFVEWDNDKELDDEKHSADVLVFDNLSINGVFYDRFMKLGTITRSPDEYTFRYLTYNQTLVKVCEVVIAFADKLFPSSTDEISSLPSDEAIKYKELEIEAGKYNRPEFDEVYKFIDDSSNLATSLKTGDKIEDALRQAGFADDEKFVSDFKKYREIEQQAREVQFSIVANALQSRQKGGSFDDAMQKAGFVKNKELQGILDGVIAAKKSENPYWPIDAPFASLSKDDEDMDALMMAGKFKIDASLTSYYRDIKKYEIDKLLNKIGVGPKGLFEILNNLCSGIKENTDKPIYTQNTITDTIKYFDDYPGCGQVIQILILQGIVVWFENCDIDESDSGYSDAQSLCDWVCRRFAEIAIFYFINFNKDENSKPLDDYLATTEIGKLWDQPYTDSASEEPQETEENRIYFIKDGQQQMPVYDFVKAINPDAPINPTHNFDLLKQHRLNTYNDAEAKFIEQRNINRVGTGDLEKNIFYHGWLRHELEIIEQWLSDTYPSGEKKKILTPASNQIEILKYKQFVDTEIERIEISVNGNSSNNSSVSRNDNAANVSYPPCLLNLKPNKCQYLYAELTKGGYFLPDNTNQNHFNYVFGGGVCPNDFAPLHWKASKRALSELVILILNKNAVPRPVKKAAKDLFISSKTNKSIGALSNPQKSDPSNDYSTLQTIANTINSSPA